MIRLVEQTGIFFVFRSKNKFNFPFNWAPAQQTFRSARFQPNKIAGSFFSGIFLSPPCIMQAWPASITAFGLVWPAWNTKGSSEQSGAMNIQTICSIHSWSSYIRLFPSYSNEATVALAHHVTLIHGHTKSGTDNPTNNRQQWNRSMTRDKLTVSVNMGALVIQYIWNIDLFNYPNHHTCWHLHTKREAKSCPSVRPCVRADERLSYFAVRAAQYAEATLRAVNELSVKRSQIVSVRASKLCCTGKHAENTPCSPRASAGWAVVTTGHRRQAWVKGHSSVGKAVNASLYESQVLSNVLRDVVF